MKIALFALGIAFALASFNFASAEQPPAKSTSTEQENDITYGPKEDGEEPAMAEADQKKLFTSPIYPEFIRKLGLCAPGCQPWVASTFFTSKLKGKCYKTGRALDLYSIRCKTSDGFKFQEAKDGGAFEQLVECLRKNGLETEYKTGKKNEAAFNDRAMVSMGCKVP